MTVLFYLALCQAEVDIVSKGTYMWPTISAELNETIRCQYGGATDSLTNPVARRICDMRGEWLESDFTECATFSDSTFRNISMVYNIFTTPPKINY